MKLNLRLDKLAIVDIDKNLERGMRHRTIYPYQVALWPCEGIRLHMDHKIGICYRKSSRDLSEISVAFTVFWIHKLCGFCFVFYEVKARFMDTGNPECQCQTGAVWFARAI